MLERLRRHIPTREQITANRWLRWLAPYFSHPRLWHWSRRGVSLGVGIGVFFGLLIPLAQIPFAAVASMILRANIPAAVASTLVTNPVTFAPVYYAAYRLGSWVTGTKKGIAGAPAADPLSVPTTDAGLWESIANMGLPLIVGLTITATIVSLFCYAAISLGWYLHVKRKRRLRKRWEKPG